MIVDGQTIERKPQNMADIRGNSFPVPDHTDFQEVESLKSDEVAHYFCSNGSELYIRRVYGDYSLREMEKYANTIYDFANGYCEDNQYRNMTDLLSHLSNYDLVAICSASGRDMTSDVRLYLAARDYYGHLQALKAPKFAIEAQAKIVKKYFDRLAPYGNACIVMRRNNVPFARLYRYKSPGEALKASVSRMNAAVKHDVYQLYFVGLPHGQKDTSILAFGIEDIRYNMRQYGTACLTSITNNKYPSKAVTQQQLIDGTIQQLNLMANQTFDRYPEISRESLTL